MTGRAGRHAYRRPTARTLAVALLVGALGVTTWAQTRSTRRPPPAPATRKEAPPVTCPAAVGPGVKTGRLFCDVLTGADPADGIVIKIPPHIGPVTLTFDLHARHTYSEELTRAGRAFARYTATAGILTMNNDLVQRAVVLAEFRSLKDAFDRIGGGAGPGGVKAIVPVGIESIKVTLDAALDQVSLLGEKVRVSRLDGESTLSAAGRPVALVSNLQIEYRPKAPPKR
jgi:hypothetical protein